MGRCVALGVACVSGCADPYTEVNPDGESATSTTFSWGTTSASGSATAETMTSSTVGTASSQGDATSSSTTTGDDDATSAAETSGGQDPIDASCNGTLVIRETFDAFPDAAT